MAVAPRVRTTTLINRIPAGELLLFAAGTPEDAPTHAAKWHSIKALPGAFAGRNAWGWTAWMPVGMGKRKVVVWTGCWKSPAVAATSLKKLLAAAKRGRRVFA
jgi:hypothetical protein